MDSFFKVSQRGSSTGQEVRAGLTTFLAMSYIIALNPLILSNAGVPISATITSTCFGAGIMTILMGIFANRPLALASGLGINSMIAVATTTLCNGDWHAAMGVIFVEGVVILVLVLCGLRQAIMDAIPISLRHGISVGLGLFIAMIGLANAGIITGDGSTILALGKVTSPAFILGVISIVATIVFVALRLRGALLLGIIVALPFLSPVLGPGAAIAQVIGVLMGQQIGAGALPVQYALPTLFAIDGQVGCDFVPVGLSLGEAQPETISVGVSAVLFTRLVTSPVAVIIAYLASFLLI